MRLATRAGDREVRLFEGTGFIPTPGSPDSWASTSLGQAELGIAAVACAVKLVAETIAGMVLRTYTGDAENRQPVLDSPQARLFQHPAEGWTSFDVWSDVVTAVELEQNAFLWKITDRAGAVVELYPVDPAYFLVDRPRTNGPKRVRAWINERQLDITDRVVHIRGWSPIAAAAGASTLGLHRRALRGAMALEDYRGRYYENNGVPSLVLELQGNPTRQQRQEFLESWMLRVAGVRNAGRPGLLWGGAKATALTSTLKDAQAAEMVDTMARDVARIFRIYPPELLCLEAENHLSSEEIANRFYRFTLFSRIRRIERALASDPDLFPDRSLYPGFDPSVLLRGDAVTMATIAHMLYQVGLIKRNEGRAPLGYPPLQDGGEEFQVTPVGGAPNPRALELMRELLVAAQPAVLNGNTP